MNIEQLIQPMMNGNDDEVKKGLLASLNNLSPLSDPPFPSIAFATDIWQKYMAELWARGISKAEFLEYAKGK